jgi:hypothetical protein
MEFVLIPEKCNPFSKHSYELYSKVETPKMSINAYSEHCYEPADFSPVPLAVIQ